jgi:hypothetical protein
VACLLIAARAGGITVSRAKLRKLLYLSDLRARKLGLSSGSGVEWRWRHDGPYSIRLQLTEKGLGDAGVIRAEMADDAFSGYRECRVHLVGDVDMDIDERFAEVIEQTVAQYGEFSVGQLRDIAYQTAPMQEALAEGRGDVRLDLAGGRPFPDLAVGLGRLRQVAERMPLPEGEPGGIDDLTEEMDQLAQVRQDANDHLLED